MGCGDEGSGMALGELDFNITHTQGLSQLSAHMQLEIFFDQPRTPKSCQFSHSHLLLLPNTENWKHKHSQLQMKNLLTELTWRYLFWPNCALQEAVWYHHTAPGLHHTSSRAPELATINNNKQWFQHSAGSKCILDAPVARKYSR